MSDREKWLEAAVLRLQASILSVLPYIDDYGNGSDIKKKLREAVMDTDLRVGRHEGQICPLPDDCFPISYTDRGRE